MDGVSNLELAHDEALPRTKRMVVRTDEHQAHNARSGAVVRTPIGSYGVASIDTR